MGRRNQLNRSSLHLGEDIANDLASIVLGHVRELRPGEGVVEVVLHLVVLRQTQQVAVLHVQQVFRLDTEGEREEDVGHVV